MASPFSAFASILCIVVAVGRRLGEPIEPIAIAVKDMAGKDVLQVGVPKLRGLRHAPYPTGPRTLIVTINAQNLAGCHLALGWRMPERILDLLVEAQNVRPAGRLMIGGFPGALAASGNSAIPGLVCGSSPAHMRRRLDAVVRLFAGTRDKLDLGRGLLRGRYLCAVAHIEATGLPVDAKLIKRLKADWTHILGRVVSDVDQGFGVFTGRRLDVGALSAMLADRHIDWPREASGAPKLDDGVFGEMARLHPALSPLKELRATLVRFDPNELAVGRDGRNRVPLRPFASSTGRNQPSAKASVLGGPAWVRNLIQPAPGTTLAMLDWQQQEFGIAAALSGDGNMQVAYRSGDPYLALAITARAAPEGSTAVTHMHVRERFKRCALGLQYGVGRTRLAGQLGISEGQAAAMIAAHRTAFPTFWAWADGVELQARIQREVQTAFGWRLPVDAETNIRSIRNYPMQANGAEMLRLACCFMTEAGIRVCAPNHDAVLIEVPSAHLDAALVVAERAMAEASEIVLDGFALRTSVRTVTAPARWVESRGQAIWAAVEKALGVRRPAHKSNATCIPPSTRSISLYDAQES